MSVSKNPQNGYGNYNDKHIERLRFIKKLQSFGFSLKEIKDAILLEEKKLMSDEIRINTLNQKLKIVNQKLEVLLEYKEFIQTALKNLKNKN